MKIIKQLYLGILGGASLLFPAFSANAEQYYVAVVHDLSSKTGDVLPPRLLKGSYNVTQSKIDTGYKVIYEEINLSKKNCKRLIKEAIKEKKTTNKTLPEDDSRYAINKTSVFADTYVIDQVSEFVSVYYCIPIQLWGEIKSQGLDHVSKTISYENDIILRKNNEDFIQKLHHCGITDYNFFHINIPNSPFVCEKYDENHPVPVQAYDDIIK